MAMRRAPSLAAICLLIASCSSPPTGPSTTGSVTTDDTTTSSAVTIDAATSYREHCSACHGNFGGGEPGGSVISDVPLRYDAASLEDVIRNGFGTMPGTPNLPDDVIALIVEYVLNDFSVGEHTR